MTRARAPASPPVARELLWPAAPALAAAALAAVVAGVFAVRDPAATIALAAACALGALVLADVTVGLRVFTVLAFFEVLPGAGGLSVAKLAGAALLFSWLVTGAPDAARSRRFAAEHAGAAALAVVFLAWVLASAAWAERPADAFGAVVRYAPNLALLPIAFAAVRTRSHGPAFAAAFIAGALLSATYGLAAGAPAGSAAGFSRLDGAGVDPNILAMALVAALALSVALAARPGARAAGRGLAAVAGLACLTALLLTGSRGGLVGLAAMLVCGVALAGRGRRVAAGLLAACVLAGAAVYVLQLAPAATRERIVHPSGGSGRADLWRVGLRVVAHHPLLGVGAGNFPGSTVHELLAPGAITRSQYIVDTPKVAHNVYLEVQAELGVPGLAMFLALIAFSLACCRSAWRRCAASADTGGDVLARGVAVAISAMLAAEVFVSQEFNKPLWLLLAVAPALRAVASQPVYPAAA